METISILGMLPSSCIKGRFKCILSLLDQNIYGKGFHFSTKDKFLHSY